MVGAGGYPSPVPSHKGRGEVRRYAALYLFVGPFAILTVVFGLWPIAESIRVAFADSQTALSDQPVYVGLENFRSVFADPALLSSIWRIGHAERHA